MSTRSFCDSHVPYFKELPLHSFLVSGLAVTVSYALPVLTHAQDFSYAIGFMGGIGSVIKRLIPLLIAIAFLVFVWGLVGFIFHSGDENAVEEGKQRMIWGVLVLFVITAIWGIVAVFQGVVGADSDMGAIQAPAVPK